MLGAFGHIIFLSEITKEPINWVASFEEKMDTVITYKRATGQKRPTKKKIRLTRLIHRRTVKLWQALQWQHVDYCHCETVQALQWQHVDYCYLPSGVFIVSDVVNVVVLVPVVVGVVDTGVVVVGSADVNCVVLTRRIVSDDTTIRL